MAGWLAKQYTILGIIPFQNWMLLAVAIVGLSILVSWWVQR